MPKDKNANAVALAGSPEKLINQLLKGQENREWALNKITIEGPPHKQVQHTLVLNRLQKLASLYKKSYGITVKHSKGYTINAGGPEHEVELPLQIPLQSLEDVENVDDVLDKMSKGPEHEILYTALLLQVIESLIEAEGSE